MWNTNIKPTMKAVFLLTAAAMALSWPQIARAQQGPCVVERGQDPLDILNTGVRHNVWIILDTSGSMSGGFGGGLTRLEAAKNVLDQLMAELVDASGNPLVNWGFVHFEYNSPNASTACDNQFQNSCVGLAEPCLYCNPPECFGDDNRQAILNDLWPLNPRGFTPNGISLDGHSADVVADGYVAGLLPGQRNFFIIVTDGDDTCECANSAWDTGLNTVSLRGSDDVPTPGPPSTNAADIRAYNAGLKGKLAYERLNPTAEDRATGEKGSVFVIGMGLGGGSRARANHLAWEASGAFYGNPNAESALFADNEAELRQTLRNALARIGVVDTEVNLGTSIVGSVKELIPQIEGISGVTVDDVLATGDQQQVREARILRARLQNNVLFATSVETGGFRGHLTATNVYRVDNFDTADETRSFDDRLQEDKQFWDAGELLQARDPDNRTILFHRRDAPSGSPALEFRIREEGGPLTNEELANILDVSAGYMRELDPTGVGARTAADAARIVVQVIRGYRLVIDSDNGFYLPDGTLNLSTVDEDNNPTWKLLDPTNVTPTVVLNPPRSPDLDPPVHHGAEYGISPGEGGFYWDHINRQTIVVIGTNGGVLHAFRADNGAELFAYIPPDILGDWTNGETPGSRSTLKDLVPLIVADNNGIQNHLFFIAASATVEDVYLYSDGQWHTALAFGRGRGGKFITALDVSNTPDWDADTGNIDDRLEPSNTTTLPRMMFHVGNRQGISDGLYDGFGETWSVPVIGNVQASSEDQWVMFVGGGYGCTDQGTNEGQFLFVIDMDTGSVIERYWAGNNPDAAIPYNGLVAMPALYNPHKDDPDQLDERDYTSRVYIGDLQGKVHKLDVYHPNSAQWSFREFFDVGGDQEGEPGLDQPITAAAAVKRITGNTTVYVGVGTGGDLRVDDSTTQFKFVAIHDQDPEGANSTPDEALWQLVLPPTWRVMVDPVVGGDLFFFAATRMERDFDACTIRFFSQLRALEITGALGLFDLDTSTGELDNPLDLGEGKVTGLTIRNDHLYVSKSGAVGIQGETVIMGREEWLPPDPVATAGNIRLFVRGFRLSPF